MLDKKQANAAADAVLQDALAKQASRTENNAKRRTFGGKWTGIGGLTGLAVGSLVAYLVLGHIFPWSIVGISLGTVIGAFIDQRMRSSDGRAGA